MANNVKKIWASGKAVVNGWLAIPSGFSAEVMAQCGFDSVTVDMQHGVQDYQSMVQCFQSMQAHPVTPMVRVPWNEPGIVGKALDGGAYGIICPMINTRKEAEALVSYCKYPPLGTRSNGPIRAGMYGEATSYQKTANDETLCIPMIETKTAIKNIEAILDVEGIAGIYVGPSDLGLSYGLVPKLDRDEPEILKAYSKLLKECDKKGIFAGIHTSGAADATKCIARGFRLVTLMNDSGMMASFAKTCIAQTRKDSRDSPEMTPPAVIRLHPDDGVVIARATLLPGAVVADGVAARERVPAGHKVAVRPHAVGEAVRRYGQIIGFATVPIEAGQHVHVQNCGMGDFAKDYAFGVDAQPTPNFDEAATFQGIRRPDGRVATRNYIGILTSVNCSAHVASLVADAFRKNPFTGDNPLADFPNVDGVVALTHKTGCGMTQHEPLAVLRRTLGGYARHVNFASVIVLGLGCEVNQIGGLMTEQKLAGRLRAMDIQEMGGTRKTVQAGIEFVREALAEANAVRREPVPASELMVALQCGGSDGYSGVSANPALGAASDLLVRHGGTVILSETPETYGAEHLLTRRAVSREVGEKLVALMRWWEEYTAREGAEMNANPSPGNKAGGLTTILEKSLGAMAKAGSTNLVDVVGYAEAVTKKGFVFMDTPGYDPVAATGQVAGGANVVCFTTGRGSVFGCKPAPSIKLATNSNMFRRMEDDMDVNCGTILDGDESVQECGQRIFEMILRVASGEQTKSETFDFGAAEFAPWVLGATM